jgi:hypothetical protein
VGHHSPPADTDAVGELGESLSGGLGSRGQSSIELASGARRGVRIDVPKCWVDY